MKLTGGDPEGQFASPIRSRQVPRRPYDLAEMVARITPENRHAEVDTGPPHGKEAWSCRDTQS